MPRVARIFRHTGASVVEYDKVYRGTVLVFSRGASTASEPWSDGTFWSDGTGWGGTAGPDVGGYVQAGYVVPGYFDPGIPLPQAVPDVRNLSASEVSVDVDVLANDV